MQRQQTAFTLIELLVVIVILGVVIAITTPALTQAKTSAAVNGSLANLRTHGVWVAAYAADHRGDLINPFAKRGPDQSVLRPGDRHPTPVPFLPDGFSPLYARLVGHDLADDWQVYDETFYAPRDGFVDELQAMRENSDAGFLFNRDAMTPASYCYSSSMYQMDYRVQVSDGATLANVIQRREISEIAYPAHKVVFHERADYASARDVDNQLRWYEAGAAPAAALADGHACIVPVDEIYASIEQGNEALQPAFTIDIRFAHDEDRPRSPFNFQSNGLFWATRDGLQGVDLP
ncbi:MAG: prepilin-type N-terminal cleavage/methylation domain-containing protein [Phycisphaerales bacterium JB038]